MGEFLTFDIMGRSLSQVGLTVLFVLLGALALEFRRRCARRGVSIERMRKFLKVTAMRAMGDGSPVMTEMASKQLMELYSLMDEKGKENVLRAVVAGIPGVGYQKVNMFVPEGEPRKIIDFDIANLENGNLRQGIQQLVHDSQNPHACAPIRHKMI
jgi:hypothetical protein